MKSTLAYKKSDKIIKGNTDGIITEAHRDKPLLTEWDISSEYKSASKSIATRIISVKALLDKIQTAFLVIDFVIFNYFPHIDLLRLMKEY